MGIKCSLFGHDFGESTVERDREEQGNEVVSTIREIETCRRCGETRVVSENTEVTTIKTPKDVDVEAEPEPDEPKTDSGADIVDAEADEPVAETEAPSPGLDAADTEYESAAEDDGVILEDDTDEGPDRGPGEWPDAESTDEARQGDGESDDGVVIDAGETESTVEDEPRGEEVDPSVVMDASTDGATDEESTDDDAEVWSSTRPDLESASADVESDDGADAIVDGEFRCTECGFTTPIESSSLREGDYCPECHQGMLVVEEA